MSHEFLYGWVAGNKDWKDLIESGTISKGYILDFLLHKKRLSYEYIERFDIDRCAWQAINEVNSNELLPQKINYYFKEYLIKSSEGYKILRQKLAYDWYQACTSQHKNAEFYFRTKLVNRQPLDREQCLKELVNDNGKLSILFRDPLTLQVDDKGEQRLYSLVTWFTRRYDLDFARWLIKQLRKEKRDPSSAPISSPPNDSSSNGKPIQIKERSLWAWFLLVCLLLILFLPPFLPVGVYSLYSPILLIIYTLLIGGVFWLTFKDLAHLWIRLLVPRLAGCIIVGYLPLVVGIETWQAMSFLAQSTWRWHTFFLMVLAGMGAFGYLMLEMKNTIPLKKVLIKRGLSIYSLGLAWSLGIGLIVMDFLASAFKKMDENKFLGDSQITWLSGVVGEIPWEIFLGYVPLALLIGIFVQIIWEEKPITEPL